MTWVRLEQDCCDHPKVDGISNGAFRLWISAKCWANRFWTDGFIDRAKLARISPQTRRHSAAAAELVRARLWHSHDDLTCGSPHCPVNLGVEARHGFIIHDFLQYQPSSAKLKRLSETRADAGRRGGLAKAKQNASGESYPDPSRSVPSRSVDREIGGPSNYSNQGTIEKTDQLEAWGYKRYGQLGGANLTALSMRLPIYWNEIQALNRTKARSWRYIITTLDSMREESVKAPPKGVRRMTQEEAEQIFINGED